MTAPQDTTVFARMDSSETIAKQVLALRTLVIMAVATEMTAQMVHQVSTVFVLVGLQVTIAM